MHHLLATNPPKKTDYLETAVFGTRAKRHEISEGILTTVKKYEYHQDIS
jgi:hypothetical protein